MVTSVFFYLLATVLILSALRVITAKNPVHAVLFLVLTFVTSSCLWLMLNVEFLALSLILVYVGAVMVLFLFVVMMLDIDTETIRSGFWKNFPLALLLGLVILTEMVIVLVTKPIVITAIVPPVYPSVSNGIQLGWLMYTEYSYPVELASMVLLLGLVVAVALTLRKTNKNGKYQNISKQVNTESKGRVKMVKMKSVIAKSVVIDEGDSK